MPNTRTLLFMFVAVLGFMLYSQWQRDYGPQPVAETSVAEGEAVSQDNNPGVNPGVTVSEQTPDDGEIPELTADLPQQGINGETEEAAATPLPVEPVASAETISVTTDVFEIEIGLQGGSIKQAKLRQYPIEADQPDLAYRLLEAAGNYFYIAQSGLVAKDAPAPDHRQTYSSPSRNYELMPGDDQLSVPLSWQQGGVQVTKTLIFTRDSYEIEVHYVVENNSGELWQGSQYAQLQRTRPELNSNFTDNEKYSFLGAAVYTPDEKYEKLDFEDFSSEPYRRTVSNGWIAMVQHYFLSAWIPPADQNTTFQTALLGSGADQRYLIRYQSPIIAVQSGENTEFVSRLYAGPKLQDRLNEVAPGLKLTVDYGIFTIMSDPLFWLLEKIHDLVGNWGWAIVLLTILIKLLFFKLTEAQYRSMARMRKLQPRIEKLKERYGDDRQKMSQAMMDLYKTEKVNPLGGGLPMLVQIPVFIALYWVLRESVELRQAPFMLWITDLTKPDPYFVLPVINGLAMVATQRMTPMPGMDPMQRKIMQFMPIAFSVMFAFFPSGLVLYWATNAVISFAQQWVITRRIDRLG